MVVYLSIYLSIYIVYIYCLSADNLVDLYLLALLKLHVTMCYVDVKTNDKIMQKL